MKLEPLANRVIATLVEEDRELKSGLVMPDIAHKNRGLSYGEVIAVGPGRLDAQGHLIKVHVEVGDVIMFPTQAAATLEIEDDTGKDTTVLLMLEGDIIAKVRDLKRGSVIVDRMGRPVPLGISGQSLALPDSVYENREGIDRAISDLKQSKAPEDVIDEVRRENVDHREGDPDLVEH